MNVKQSTKGRNQDRSKVAGGHEHQENYEKQKMKVPAEEVKNAIKSVGNSRKKVEEKLKK